MDADKDAWFVDYALAASIANSVKLQQLSSASSGWIALTWRCLKLCHLLSPQTDNRCGKVTDANSWSRGDRVLPKLTSLKSPSQPFDRMGLHLRISSE